MTSGTIAPPAAPRRAPHPLRTELLVSFALLATTALVMAVGSVVLVLRNAEPAQAATAIAGLVALDACVFVAYGAWVIRRRVIRPLEDAIATTIAIAGGDLSRRLAPGDTREFAALADSVNRMTDHLLDAQAQHTRIEKLASVGRLAAGIAHEIGNPLGAINGYTHILRMRTNDPQLADSIDGLERESMRIDRIVRGLLEYARPRRMTPVPIDVNDVVRGAVGLLHDQGALRRVTLQLALDPALPPLFGERHELEQLLVNLLLNAVDAMDDGVGTIAVRTRRVDAATLRSGATRRSGDAAGIAVDRTPPPRVTAWLDREGGVRDVVQLVVADSGTGVPDADAERIFDPFYTTKAPGKGTGLGLAIVARTVDNLHGTVWVQPAREGGAAFMLLFAAPAHGWAGSVA